MLLAGVLATLLQSRRLTEGSIYQNSAVTVVQGYVEQIKAIEFADLPYLNKAGVLVPGAVPGKPAEVATRLDQSAPDPLTISTALPIPAVSTILSPDTPENIVDNLKVIDINRTDGSPEFEGSSETTPNIATDDLRLRIWLWIQDISDDTVDATQVRSITILYSWQVNDGNQTRTFAGTVRTIRSSVPTH